ncbi:MAG: carbonic anhydrase [Motiliproteus sp.]
MPATDKLMQGYQRFRAGYYQQNKASLIKLAEAGQAPKIALISCCDSRVEPSIILDCDPGDLFVVRNVANLVPPCEYDHSLHGTSAALEFAVTGLGVESVIVLGHSQCGGIKSLMDRSEEVNPDSFIWRWMSQLQTVRQQVLDDPQHTSATERYQACELAGIGQSLEHLMEFPWIRSRVEARELTLHGWYYDLNNAELKVLQTGTQAFQSIR